MKGSFLTGALIAMGIVAAAFMLAGRYQLVASDGAVYRIDRWFGSVAFCTQWEGGSVWCAVLPDEKLDSAKAQTSHATSEPDQGG